MQPYFPGFRTTRIMQSTPTSNHAQNAGANISNNEVLKSPGPKNMSAITVRLAEHGLEEQRRSVDRYLQTSKSEMINALQASSARFPPNTWTSGDPATSVGTKFDDSKLRVDLLDPLALEGISRVLTFGAKKYNAHNWRGGISYSRLIGALLRHLFAIMRREDLDPESGLPHIDHLGCCWMFLSNAMKTRQDLDDRYNDILMR
jgi:hypothetical protein